jgi:hypothetical protein
MPARRANLNLTLRVRITSESRYVKTVTTTEAKAKPNALLADVERTGASVTIESWASGSCVDAGASG